MDTKFQTSFIPKKPVVQGTTRPKTQSISLFSLIGIIVFILSLSAAGGVFAYKRILINRIDEMSRRLAEAKNSFEPNFIEELNRFNKRIEAANKILTSHSAFSAVFDLLENNTLASVKLNSLNYELKDNGSAALSVSGEAQSFNSVALQSDALGKEKYLKSQVFSDLNPDKSGNIVFKFSALVDPALISYKNSISTAAGVRN